jgi:phosphoribosylformylglycinamidine synthase subunit PurL
MEITVKTAEQLRLTAAEFQLIQEKLGRMPNFNGVNTAVTKTVLNG